MSSVLEAASRRIAILGLILGEHLTSRSRLDLLVFWGRYPGGWFGRRAIRPFTRSSRKEIERALDELVEEGVIRCRRDGATAWYALTEAGGIRRAVQELPRLTRSERRYLLQQSRVERGARIDQQHGRRAPKLLREIAQGTQP